MRCFHIECIKWYDSNHTLVNTHMQLSFLPYLGYIQPFDVTDARFFSLSNTGHTRQTQWNCVGFFINWSRFRSISRWKRQICRCCCTYSSSLKFWKKGLFCCPIWFLVVWVNHVFIVFSSLFLTPVVLYTQNAVLVPVRAGEREIDTARRTHFTM